MDEAIRLELEKEKVSEWHQALLSHCVDLTNMSKRKMSNRYEEWRIANDTYRGLAEPDEKDEKAQARGEPIKMVVPMTFAQVQTFVAFCVSLFTQREKTFELVGVSEEDHKAAKLGEALLQRDLIKNQFEARLYQLALDVARFGVGILKTSWVEETEMKYVQKAKGVVSKMFSWISGQDQYGMEETVKFQGNSIVNVSPFRFYPDTRLPISRFQEGEFVSSEEVFTMVQLKQMQKDGQVAGVKWVEPYTKNAFARVEQMEGNKEVDDVSASTIAANSPGSIVLTECQVKIVPSEFLINDEPMGEADSPEIWNVWYVNGERIVKAEPMGYSHNLFSYDLAEYTPDMHNQINDGLATTIDNLQSVITWLINSHIASVRKTIQNWLVYNPEAIMVEDISERRPGIRIKPAYANQPIDKHIKQLDVHDVTASHMGDAQMLQTLVQTVTGINDNALGQFHSGRRSATEARNVNSATASRLKMHALLIWRTCLEPMGRKMISNHQQGLTAETFVKVQGANADPAQFANFVKITQKDLVGDYDFEIFDGTLPSERGERAMAIEEFLITMMKAPQMAPVIGFDPVRLVKEWMELRGIRNPERFLMDAVRQRELVAQVQTMYGQGQPNADAAGVPAGADQGIEPGTSGVLQQPNAVVQ